MLRALRRVADAGLPLPLQLGRRRAGTSSPPRSAWPTGRRTPRWATPRTRRRGSWRTAPPGTVHAHPAVLDHSRTLFAVTPRGPFPMKGKAAPVLVYEVGEELGSRESVDATRLPFLGRDAELARARAALERALSGEGGVLTVEGPAGIGSTRLAQEALDAAGATSRLALRAEPYGASSAYRVLRDPLRALLGIARGTREEMGAALLAALAARAPALLPMAPLLADVVQVAVPSTPEADRVDTQYRADRVADVVVELLDAVSPGPLAVVVEDAHWADGASVHLLGRLASATSGRPWAVVVVRRGERDGFVPASGTHIVLDPLPPEVVEQLVHAATEATPLRPHEVAAVVAKAGGNPLFVEEVTRARPGRRARSRSCPSRCRRRWAPRSTSCRPRRGGSCATAPCSGCSFRREVLARHLAADGLTLDPATLAALGGLHRGRRRRTGSASATAWSATRRTRGWPTGCAPASTARPVRCWSGSAPTSTPTPPALVLHFARAGDAPRTWGYAQRAGRLARASYANADAADHFETALEVSRRLPEVTDADRARAVGESSATCASWPACSTESVEAYRAAARLTRDDPVATAEVLSRQAAAHLRTGAFTTTLRVVSRARRLLDGSRRPDRPPHPGAARHPHGRGARGAGAPAGGPRVGDRGPWRRPARVGEHETHVRALMLVDMVDLQLGVPGLGARHREALEICVGTGCARRSRRSRSNLGRHGLLRGPLDRGRAVVPLQPRRRDGGGQRVRRGPDRRQPRRAAHQPGPPRRGARRCSSSAVRVLRASGRRDVPGRGPDAAGAGAPQPRRPRRGRAARRRGGGDFSAARQPHQRARGGPRPGRGGAPRGPAGRRSRIIDAAERDGSVPTRRSPCRGRACSAAGPCSRSTGSRRPPRWCTGGLVAAREQELPYEEALLLRVGSAAVDRASRRADGCRARRARPRSCWRASGLAALARAAARSHGPHHCILASP